MKLTALALAIVTVVGLTGCAATHAPAGFSMEPDLAKIQAINHLAKGQGVQVVWINAPLKAVRTAGS